MADSIKHITVSTRLTEEEKMALVTIALEKDISVAKLIRRIVQKYLKEGEK